MTKREEEARKVVREFRELGGAFVEDEYITVEGVEIYNPTVNNVGAEGWLLEMLMKK